MGGDIDTILVLPATQIGAVFISGRGCSGRYVGGLWCLDKHVGQQLVAVTSAS